MTKRKGFSGEFKREAVRLLETSTEAPGRSRPRTGSAAQSTLQVERADESAWRRSFPWIRTRIERQR